MTVTTELLTLNIQRGMFSSSSYSEEGVILPYLDKELIPHNMKAKCSAPQQNSLLGL